MATKTERSLMRLSDIAAHAASDLAARSGSVEALPAPIRERFAVAVEGLHRFRDVLHEATLRLAVHGTLETSDESC
jgi:hypothetical protein